MSQLRRVVGEAATLFRGSVGVKWDALESRSEGDWVRSFESTHVRPTRFAAERFHHAVEACVSEIEAAKRVFE